ncbi:RNA polymerase, sigma-24 subunit, ECF subfamily [Methylobacterium sp. 4-46]|uniref:sigma-70 family RNA polymerase sigma factor n=1 Tax=Methylobacterium sp. CB376 TaxID=3138063 RepID=UPI000152C979|nr:MULTISPECIES: sigma-70 family RNA polymerase sigma factor [Methylobacterium]ACA19118.1 RNA polymerase, sigma-24 subunit, ECF subfamily [Methylobacterium sp. 4-46]WFT78329.1 sigma-70 family RNA polymerase sigma factor [Methylobacterium nodulans]
MIRARALFDATVLPHLDAAYSLARFLARDADAAEDIVQEAMLRAFRGFDGFRGGDARAWLLAIVRNCARSWAAARPRAAAGAAEEGGPEDPWDREAETPEASLARGDEIAAVRALVAALPEPFRETLVLRELEDLSYRDVAAVTGVPVGTVMSRLARARALFGAAWRRRFGEESLPVPKEHETP